MVTDCWELCEGVTDLDNNFNGICVRQADTGIEVAYVSCDILREVTLAGTFDVCHMCETGYTEGQVAEFLPPGYIAIPVISRDSQLVLTIGPDYELSFVDEMDVVVDSSIISVESTNEYTEFGETDERLRMLLGIL